MLYKVGAEGGQGRGMSVLKYVGYGGVDGCTWVRHFLSEYFAWNFWWDDFVVGTKISIFVLIS